VGVRKRRVTRGARNIAWIEATCRIPEGKFVGQPVKLRPWQRKIVLGIYDSPTRRALISFGRKNAKTTLAAILLLLHLVGPEARPNSQLFSDAQSRDQAAILFALAAKIVRMSPDLREYVTVRDTAKQLFCAELGTIYRALSAEVATAYGLSPVFVVHDELGQVRGPRSELYEALETAAGAQEEPLSIVISTQAPTDADLLSVLIDDAKRGVDKRTKLFLFSAPMELDPFSEEAIRAANPAYGDFLNAEEVRDQAEGARRMPAREAAYRNLILNQRVQSVAPWISINDWQACLASLDLEDMAGRACYGGLDLSGKNDLTALVLVFPLAGSFEAFSLFWTPEEGLRERAARDRTSYVEWVRQGFLQTTPGRSIDYAFIAQKIAEVRERVELKAIAFDRWRIDDLVRELEEIGISCETVAAGEEPKGNPDLTLIPHGQGFRDMGPAVEALETAVLNGQFKIATSPVMTMCALNAVCIADPSGNRKFDKRPGKSTGRIDGIVAAAMAMRCAKGTVSVGDSVYETRGVLRL
jgi:phage terminase large subunit-like protein